MAYLVKFPLAAIRIPRKKPVLRPPPPISPKAAKHPPPESLTPRRPSPLPGTVLYNGTHTKTSSQPIRIPPETLAPGDIIVGIDPDVRGAVALLHCRGDSQEEEGTRTERECIDMFAASPLGAAAWLGRRDVLMDHVANHHHAHVSRSTSSPATPPLPRSVDDQLDRELPQWNALCNDATLLSAPLASIRRLAECIDPEQIVGSIPGAAWRRRPDATHALLSLLMQRVATPPTSEQLASLFKNLPRTTLHPEAFAQTSRQIVEWLVPVGGASLSGRENASSSSSSFSSSSSSALWSKARVMIGRKRFDMYLFDIPSTEIIVNKKARLRPDVTCILTTLRDLLLMIQSTPPDPSSSSCPSPSPLFYAYIEQPMTGGQGEIAGTLGLVNSGYNYGLYTGILASLQATVVHVRPVEWKADVGLKRAEKDASRMQAGRVAPRLEGAFRRKLDHGRAEAVLLAAWGAGFRSVKVEGMEERNEQEKEEEEEREGKDEETAGEPPSASSSSPPSKFVRSPAARKKTSRQSSKTPLVAAWDEGGE